MRVREEEVCLLGFVHEFEFSLGSNLSADQGFESPRNLKEVMEV